MSVIRASCFDSSAGGSRLRRGPFFFCHRVSSGDGLLEDAQGSQDPEVASVSAVDDL